MALTGFEMKPVLLLQLSLNIDLIEMIWKDQKNPIIIHNVAKSLEPWIKSIPPEIKRIKLAQHFKNLLFFQYRFNITIYIWHFVIRYKLF